MRTNEISKTTASINERFGVFCSTLLCLFWGLAFGSVVPTDAAVVTGASGAEFGRITIMAMMSGGGILLGFAVGVYVAGMVALGQPRRWWAYIISGAVSGGMLMALTSNGGGMDMPTAVMFLTFGIVGALGFAAGAHESSRQS